MPTLPVKLESLESAATRFPAAVAKPWDVGTVNEDLPVGDRAGKHRESVFDVEDGDHPVRFIISRDRHPDSGRELLHVSASAIQGEFATAEERLRQVRRLLDGISGLTLPAPDATKLSAGRVLHLFWSAEVLDSQEDHRE